MAKSIGPEVPAALAELLADDERALGIILALISVDRRGFPHVALVSPGEIAQVDERRLRVALRVDGRAVENLRARPAATLVMVEPAGCAYLLLRARDLERRLAPAPTLPFSTTVVELELEETRIDAEAGATVVTGARYARALGRDAELAAWRATREALCRD
ncbi:hypothetical protein DSM104299_02052 [Baekduia alba]|uniref:hypothetical protein n=1 Tax=Baekduia alba TaxID=2997333 RepID=UPI002341AE53|nr:hypothetical protein [Baekduia alba]WCB93339.1 hypothetical protein DSM104299_02052 [Baekduia alba]